jgi:oligopeptide/dipeptide ABC transporter ATP-binding protein
MQIIFQDPFSSLNPHMRVGDILTRRCASTVSAAGGRSGASGSASFWPGRPQAHPRRALPARVLRRPAAAHRHRPGRSRSSPTSSSRTTRLGPRRLDPGADREPPAQPPGGARPDHAVHRHKTSPVVHEVADRVAVMYLRADRRDRDHRGAFARPHHPYTLALLSAAPVPDPEARRASRIILEGDIPSPLDPPSGCVLPHPAAPRHFRPAPKPSPPLREVAPGRLSACIRDDVQEEAWGRRGRRGGGGGHTP